MEYRMLGKTGLKVSVMGFGGIPIQRVSEEKAVEIVNFALSKGINFIDSARGYTDSEEKLGIALKGQRDKVVIATKTMARDKNGMARDIDTSLKNFQTDYIDLYQLHNVKTDNELEKILGPDGALEALFKAKKDGKIGHIGITGHIDKLLIKAINEYNFATVQFPRNYMEDVGEKELFPEARKKEMGTIIMKPLAGGAFKRVELALRYLLGFDYSTIIPGMDSLEQIEMNTALANEYKPLDEEEMQQLIKEANVLGQKFCRRCEYCKPCPQGIDIPGFFIIHGYFERYGLTDWATERYRNIKPSAKDCIECGICETRCPYDLPIREMLKKVDEDLGEKY